MQKKQLLYLINYQFKHKILNDLVRLFKLKESNDNKNEESIINVNSELIKRIKEQIENELD